MSVDRVRVALAHREPDHVPLFAPNIIDTRQPYDPGLRSFLAGFPFDELAGISGAVSYPSAHRKIGQDLFEDGYGCRFRYMGVGLPYCVYSPLADAATVADVEAFPWPDPEARGWVADDARDKARAARAVTHPLISVHVPALFHQYHYLRGFERWMLDVATARDLHRAIADHVFHINRTLILRLLEQVGEHVDLVSTGDDLGHSTAPYMSPADLRALVKPYYQDLVGTIKARWPHLRFYLHSHGQIMDFVPDLIDCGVDVLNPVLPLDGMEPQLLKRQFGDRLCFHGGIDIEHIVPFGTVDQVRHHVRQVIDVLAPGGGYWFKAQAISPVMPPRNVIAAYECALEYGTYA